MKKRSFLAAAVAFLMIAGFTPVHASNPHWEKDDNGWRYDNGDGTNPKEEFKLIDGSYYYFDASGYMVTGWQTILSNQYFFKDSGAMAHAEWVGEKGDEWVDYHGMRVHDWWVDSGQYYVDNEGYWDAAKGKRNTGWRQDSNGWWFATDDGKLNYAVNMFMEIGRERYLFGEDGYMKTGWQLVGGEGGRWMYFGNDGAERHDQWIGDYWLDRYGYMVKEEWVDNGKYYVGKDGKWIPDYGVKKWKQDANGWWFDNGDGTYPHGEFMIIDGVDYYFKDDGYMAVGWQLISDEWYFFTGSGAMKKNAWEGNYWLKADGKMAKSEWVDDDRYYVDATGLWDPNAKK